MAAPVPVQAQSTGDLGLYDFELLLEGRTWEVNVTESFEVTGLFRDLSRDGPSGLVSDPPVQFGYFIHSVSFEVVPTLEDHEGWFVFPLSGFSSVAGAEKPFKVKVRADTTATNSYFQLNVTAHIRTDGGTYNETSQVNFYSPGLAGFSFQKVLGDRNLSPREISTTTLELTNPTTNERVYDLEIVANTCNLDVAPPSTVVIPNGVQRKKFTFDVAGPDDQFWYYSESCQLRLVATVRDNAANQQELPLTFVVDGFYVDPTWMFWGTALAMAFVVLLLLAKRRKERIEEEILGKPQKPWTIPSEKVYLRHLKARDERAWYVVRNYLMEDEYRSSLLWYHSYRKATKGSRAKERLILEEEKSYAKWKARWERRIAKPLLEADRFEARLQRKLDRKSRKRHRKLLRKHRKVVAKMRSAHERVAARALERWKADAAKAEKKGRPVPPKPDPKPPLYPAEPPLVGVPLASHRWARKARRFRARRVREQGNLEVKFEKQDARRLDRIERKVRKIARRLDDPVFVREHPLVRKA